MSNPLIELARKALVGFGASETEVNELAFYIEDAITVWIENNMPEQPQEENDADDLLF